MIDNFYSFVKGLLLIIVTGLVLFLFYMLYLAVYPLVSFEPNVYPANSTVGVLIGGGG